MTARKQRLKFQQSTMETGYFADGGPTNEGIQPSSPRQDGISNESIELSNDCGPSNPMAPKLGASSTAAPMLTRALVKVATLN
jgi:hypothetical protein